MNVPDLAYSHMQKVSGHRCKWGRRSATFRRPSGRGVPTVPLFGSKFWRENSEKWSRKFKKPKNVRHYLAKTFFSSEGPFYPVFVQSNLEGGDRHMLAVVSVGPERGGGT